MMLLMSNNKVFFVKKLKERKKDHMFKSIYKELSHPPAGYLGSLSSSQLSKFPFLCL